VFLLVPAHPGSPRQRAIKLLLLMLCRVGHKTITHVNEELALDLTYGGQELWLQNHVIMNSSHQP